MVLTKEQQEIEDFLRKAQEKPEEEYDYRKHEDFNFQAVFKKSVREPKTRLVY